jgi:pre-peptidase
MAFETRTRRRVSGAVLAIAFALVASGCDWFKNDSSPSDTTTTTETFTGTLAAQGSNIYTFTVAKSGTVKVTLTSVAPTATTPVGLGIGTPSGTSCTVTSSTPSATAGSNPQITVTQNPGSYCIRVFDGGAVTTAITFSITVEHT